jgi:hypothetical protein
VKGYGIVSIEAEVNLICHVNFVNVLEATVVNRTVVSQPCAVFNA